MKPSTPVGLPSSSPSVLIPSALASSNRALLDGVHHGLLSRRSPTSVAMFSQCSMNFEEIIHPVRFVSSSSIVLIAGALESSNQALLDDVHHGLLSRRSPTSVAMFSRYCIDF
jgi:hypothetical protein